jgi:hypothetical protein
VYFPPDLYDGVIEIIASDGKHLRSRPYAICYCDGSNTVVIATLTNSVGLLLPSGNCVSYTNTFSGLEADIVCSYWKRGFECDLVFRERPPSPAEYGLDPATSRIQLLTEFLNTPDPAVRLSKANLADALTDATLDFGALRLGPGWAFYLGDPSGDGRQPSIVKKLRSSLPVYKRWEKLLDGDSKQLRSFLIEEVPYERIEEHLSQLAALEGPRRWFASSGLNKGTKLAGLLTPARPIQISNKKIELAQSEARQRPGVVLDYTTISIDEAYDYVFKADTTYQVCIASLYGTTTIEGGSVLKFVNDGGEIFLNGPVNCKTSPYHPAVLTCEDDNSVGEQVTPGITPVFTNECFLVWSPGTNATLRNIRFAHADAPIYLSDTSKLEVWDCQFVSCRAGLSLYLARTNAVALHNVLFTGTYGIEFYSQPSWSISAENVTADVSNFVHWSSSYLGTVFLTNSIITGSVINTGAHNPTIVTNQVALNPQGTVFQTVGAGAYYLADQSPYRNVGTTNLNSTLLADLRERTTYPPVVYSNLFLTTETSLGPQAQRDTDIPDLGYHYAPLDYVFGGV